MCVAFSVINKEKSLVLNLAFYFKVTTRNKITKKQVQWKSYNHNQDSCKEHGDLYLVFEKKKIIKEKNKKEFLKI